MTKTFLILTTLMVNFLLTINTPARAAEFHLPLYDSDDQYFAEVLRLALKADGGEHELVIHDHTVGQLRTMRELEEGKFNIFYTGYSREREQTFIQVNVPLARGLLGYRLLAIRQVSADLIRQLHGFEAFKSVVTLGTNASWPDTKIMQSAGLQVITAPTDALWPMLKRGRFLAFPRSVIEVKPELERHDVDAENPLIIAPNVMLAYKYDTFFYVAKNREDLARIVENGLEKAYEDGSFMAHFDADPNMAYAMKQLEDHPRKIHWIGVPDMSDATRAIPDRYWYQGVKD
ncbi:hypothetical protein [Kordiimonas sp.]|uniref:hypothetical protein n=1 Tax=Kordiimonas sp. TaxID=1970157 RepID=UPI003A9240C5